MKHVHLIGIGGTGMSAIARILLEKGYTVSGSDREVSPLFNALTAAGAHTFHGHAAEQIANADLVIRSSAIPDDNPEILAAKENGIPVLKRSDFLEELTKNTSTLAVAGSHGKTTTTAMLAWILEEINLDPSFIVGGVVSQLGCNAKAGTGSYFVIEADEYDYMFLGLSPKIAIVTNIEHDHPDCFPSMNAYRAAFRAFIQRIRKDGVGLICVDDPESKALLTERTLKDQKLLGYGKSPKAEYQAFDIKVVEQSLHFQIRHQSNNGRFETLGTVRLQVPGQHNILNATAALAAIHQLELPLEDAIRALEDFTGAHRRFEVIGDVDGTVLIDDYGHHPTQIKATLEAARMRYPGQRIWAIWQPHTFSRTKSLEAEFTKALSLADRVLVMKIYAAREDDSGYSAETISKNLPQGLGVYIPDFSEATQYLLDELEPGDVALFFSAGDATVVSRAVLTGLQNNQTGAR